VRGRFAADVRLSELLPPQRATLEGRVIGPLGAASGVGHIRLAQLPEGTRADYDYEIAISGKIASIGGRMLDGAARAVIALFFRKLIAATVGAQRPWWRSLLDRAGAKPR
jgi:2-furoyl-CoA dehydrogenase large subunit